MRLAGCIIVAGIVALLLCGIAIHPNTIKNERKAEIAAREILIRWRR